MKSVVCLYCLSSHKLNTVVERQTLYKCVSVIHLPICVCVCVCIFFLYLYILHSAFFPEIAEANHI